MLRTHWRMQTATRRAIGSAWAGNDLVFSRHDGTWWNPQSVSSAFRRAVRKVGAPRVRLHDLRHNPREPVLGRRGESEGRVRGELIALTRRRVDLEQGTLAVVEQYLETNDGQLHLGPPKSDAGRRTTTIPPVILPELQAHLDEYAGEGPDGLVFCGDKAGVLHRSNFDKTPRWREATASAGVPGLRFHDLRHTGNTLAAATGASTRELMARMGHASPRAALIYQHATRERDTAISQALSEMVTRARPGPSAAD